MWKLRPERPVSPVCGASTLFTLMLCGHKRAHVRENTNTYDRAKWLVVIQNICGIKQIFLIIFFPRIYSGRSLVLTFSTVVLCIFICFIIFQTARSSPVSSVNVNHSCLIGLEADFWKCLKYAENVKNNDWIYPRPITRGCWGCFFTPSVSDNKFIWIGLHAYMCNLKDLLQIYEQLVFPMFPTAWK